MVVPESVSTNMEMIAESHKLQLLKWININVRILQGKT